MHAAIWHALVLTATAIMLWILVGALLRRAVGRRPNSVSPESPTPLSAGELEAVLRKLYARKMLCRLGVIAGCALALGAYFSGGHRLWVLASLLGACWCQYGVYRHKTTDCLSELMRRRAGSVCPEEAGQQR